MEKLLFTPTGSASQNLIPLTEFIFPQEKNDFDITHCNRITPAGSTRTISIQSYSNCILYFRNFFSRSLSTLEENSTVGSQLAKVISQLILTKLPLPHQDQLQLCPGPFCQDYSEHTILHRTVHTDSPTGSSPCIIHHRIQESAVYGTFQKDPQPEDSLPCIIPFYLQFRAHEVNAEYICTLLLMALLFSPC